MELHNIEKLLEKYFEATTTVAEEETLRSYFSQKEVAPHLEQYAAMFTYFSTAKEEQFTKQVPLKPRKNYKWLSVAAVAVLVFGLYLGKNTYEQRQAEYAYTETRNALNLIANNLSKGKAKMAYLQKFDETKQKIYNK